MYKTVAYLPVLVIYSRRKYFLTPWLFLSILSGEGLVGITLYWCVFLFVFSIKHCTIFSNNVDHLLLNLTLSDIMVSLANASTLQKDSNWIEMIRKFVTETLEDGSRLNSKQLNRLLGVAWRLIQIQPNRGRWCCFVLI